jgi:Holliday junction resolvase
VLSGLRSRVVPRTEGAGEMSGLQRRKPLRAAPRSKGNRAEREIIDLLHSFGWTSARRNFQSGGQGGGDIINGPADVHIEVKHHERCSIWAWIAQAESEARPTDVPLVAFRRNRSQWYATVPLDEYLALLRLRETS